MENDIYYQKYLKYKTKYLELKYGAGPGSRKKNSGKKKALLSIDTKYGSFGIGPVVSNSSGNILVDTLVITECRNNLDKLDWIKKIAKYNPTVVRNHISRKKYITPILNSLFGLDKKEPIPKEPNPSEDDIQMCIKKIKDTICENIGSSKYKRDELIDKIYKYFKEVAPDAFKEPEQPKKTGGDPVENLF
jgi:hypothetical protein